MLSRRNFISGLATAGAVIPIQGFTKETAKEKMPICIFSKHLPVRFVTSFEEARYTGVLAAFFALICIGRTNLNMID